MGRPLNSVERMLVVNVDTSGECWIWKNKPALNGYGKTTIGKKATLAHRAFYEHFKGPITPGNQIDHLCRNRLCVNPAHLEDVTARENTMRSDNPTALNSRKTLCVSGHPLEGENLYMTPGGRRNCKICRKEATQKSQLKRR